MSKKKEFFDSDKQVFYTPKSKTTVLLCRIQFTVTELESPISCNVISESNRGNHEEEFIRDAKKCYKKKVDVEHYTLNEILIVMLINNSPCFRCRQELEHYLTTLADKGIKVTFILRMGDLYSDGFTEYETERKLAFWKNDLEMQRVTVHFEAINVVQELPIKIKKKKKQHERSVTRKTKSDLRILKIVKWWQIN